MELPVDDEAHAGTAAYRDEAKGPHFSSVPHIALCERSQVDVVLYERVGTERAPQGCQDLRALPTWDVGCQDEGTPGGVVHARAAYHYLAHLVPSDASGRDKLAGEGDQFADTVGGVHCMGGPGEPSQYRAAYVGERAPQVLSADVQAEHVAGVG